MPSPAAEQPPVSITDALIPLLFLIVGLVVSVQLYGAEASSGFNQMALLLAGCVALLIGLKNGLSWRKLEREVHQSMAIVFAPVFILLAVGMMIAAWVAGGIIPTMIYYGLLLLDPSYFYLATCLVCAIASLSIGSSWTTAATVGVALIGTAAGLGVSPFITAGAVISGAYFGDKMSPLSDSTNLAPAVVGVDLFAHIRHMIWTGVPSLAVALVLFAALGLASAPEPSSSDLESTLAVLRDNFHIAWYMLLPLLALFCLAWKKMPAFPAILIAALLGALYALLLQNPAVLNAESAAPTVLERVSSVWLILVGGYGAATGDGVLDDLLSGGGAASMLNTIWLILCAVFFGSAMEKTGILRTILTVIIRRARNTASLISATVLTCIGANVITSDQYISIVLPGRMYQATFQKRQLAAVNLSRAIEDSATVTSPLVPWNTCGAFMAASLGVPTSAYLPFCFFNLTMPLLSMLYGLINFRILPLEK